MPKEIRRSGQAAGVADGPIQPGSVLYRAFEMIAKAVAKKLATEQAAGENSRPTMVVSVEVQNSDGTRQEAVAAAEVSCPQAQEPGDAQKPETNDVEDQAVKGEREAQ